MSEVDKFFIGKIESEILKISVCLTQQKFQPFNFKNSKWIKIMPTFTSKLHNKHKYVSLPINKLTSDFR